MHTTAGNSKHAVCSQSAAAQLSSHVHAETQTVIHVQQGTMLGCTQPARQHAFAHTSLLQPAVTVNSTERSCGQQQQQPPALRVKHSPCQCSLPSQQSKPVRSAHPTGLVSLLAVAPS
jgi:hypothetical protein